MPIWIKDLLLSLILALLEKWGKEVMKDEQDAKEKVEMDEQRNVRDQKNAERYRKAQTRADKIRNATDLLNRNNP